MEAKLTDQQLSDCFGDIQVALLHTIIEASNRGLQSFAVALTTIGRDMARVLEASGLPAPENERTILALLEQVKQGPKRCNNG